MSRFPAPLAASLFSLAALGGCAAPGEFPSLSPRAIETNAAAGPAAEAPPLPTAADPELARQIAAIVAAAESAHAGFVAELSTARSTITGAAGAAAGSERWVAAQQAYSRADAARAPLVSALADLDALRRARIDSAAPADIAALDGAAERLGAIEAEETSSLNAIAANLG